MKAPSRRICRRGCKYMSMNMADSILDKNICIIDGDSPSSLNSFYGTNSDEEDLKPLSWRFLYTRDQSIVLNNLPERAQLHVHEYCRFYTREQYLHYRWWFWNYSTSHNEYGGQSPSLTRRPSSITSYYYHKQKIWVNNGDRSFDHICVM
jgi:hypothetical protein